MPHIINVNMDHPAFKPLVSIIEDIRGKYGINGYSLTTGELKDRINALHGIKIGDYDHEKKHHPVEFGSEEDLVLFMLGH